MSSRSDLASPASVRRSALAGLAVTLVTMAVTLSAATAGASGGPALRAARAAAGPTVEAQLLGHINAERARVGVGAVSGDGYLDAYATRHVAAVAHTGQLFHSEITSLLGRHLAVAENVAWAGSPAAAHDAFLRSAPHHQNLVGAGYGRVGIGVASLGGRVFVVYVFAD